MYQQWQLPAGWHFGQFVICRQRSSARHTYIPPGRPNFNNQNSQSSLESQVSFRGKEKNGRVLLCSVWPPSGGMGWRGVRWLGHVYPGMIIPCKPSRMQLLAFCVWKFDLQADMAVVVDELQQVVKLFCFRENHRHSDHNSSSFPLIQPVFSASC